MPNLTMNRASGLYTFQNFLSSIPEGALVDATNVIIDRDAIIEPRRGINDYGNFGINSSRVKQLLQYKDRILAHYGTTLSYDNGVGVFTDFSGTFTDVQSGLRIKGVELNGNFYVTTSSGIKKIAANTSTLSTASVSDAGGVKALDAAAFVNYGTPGFFTPLSKVAYRIVWGTNDVNSNLILGSPSTRFIVTNFDTTQTSTVDITFSVPNEITTNYFYQVYRTAISSAISLSLLEQVDPGDEMRLVYEAAITSNEVTTKTVIVNDITSDAFQIGGTLLYTNPVSGEGILQSNEKPPVAKDVALFKNSIFYANTRTRHRLDLNLLGLSDFSKKFITSSSLVSTTLTLTSTAHGYTNGQLVAIIIPNSKATFATTDVNTTTNTITITGHGLTNNQAIQFTSTGTLPSPLVVNTPYYILNATTNTFKLTGSFGGAGEIDLTTTGTGTHSIATYIINNVYTISGVTTNTFNITVPLTTVITNTAGAAAFSSYITITDSFTTNKYFFVGNPEVTIATFDTKANTTFGSWFEIGSSDDVSRYVVWFDVTGTTPQPVASPIAIYIKVDVSAIGAGVNVAPYVKSAIEAKTTDFIIDESPAGTLTFITSNNGRVVDAVAGAISPGGAFTIATSQQGYGEDPVKMFIRISGYVSVAQAVDDTARSMVKIINKNASEIIYGYYLSGPDDVPGIMTFESRVLNDTIFTITSNNSDTGALFNPDITTAASSSDEESANRIYFSKYQQPEAVPLVNYIDIGPKDKAIIRIVPLRDSLFIFKEDGIYRLTGEVSPNFSVILFDNSVQLIAADTPAVLSNQIYCITDSGISTVSDSGVGIISRPIENVFTRITTDNYPNFSSASFGVSYETDRAYFIWTVTNQTDTYATQCFRYNTFTRTWVRWDVSQTCGLVSSSNNKLHLGSSTSNTIDSERKSLTRRDYADKEYSLQFSASSLIDTNTILISSTLNVSEGDAIVQAQYVTINQFNSLLLKLDIDPRIGMSPGSFDINYYSTLAMSASDNLTVKMTDLVTKLNADPGTSHGYLFSGSTNFATIQIEYNTMITAMNADSKLKFSNYMLSVGTEDIEMTIVTFNNNTNIITTSNTSPYIVGPFTLFKGIQSTVIWAPITMGDSSLLKHIRESTIMFEASNFRGGELGFSSDLSPAFENIMFEMDGNGVWGGFSWGDNLWGGSGSSVPFRTYIPRQKQRCRFLKTKFHHDAAFYSYAILGLSFVFEVSSERAYRGKSG